MPVCVSTSEAIARISGESASISPPMRSTEAMSRLELPCSWARRRPTSSVALCVEAASDFTSPATTEKALPASPARAASIIAFSATRSILRAIEPIMPTIEPISPVDVFKASTLKRASCVTCLPSSASALTSRRRRLISSPEALRSVLNSASRRTWLAASCAEAASSRRAGADGARCLGEFADVLIRAFAREQHRADEADDVDLEEIENLAELGHPLVETFERRVERFKLQAAAFLPAPPAGRVRSGGRRAARKKASWKTIAGAGAFVARSLAGSPPSLARAAWSECLFFQHSEQALKKIS